MKTISVALVLLACGAVWLAQRQAATQLELAIVERREQQHALAGLTAERARMQQAKHATVSAEPEANKPPPAAAPPEADDAPVASVAPLLSRWQPASAWKNRGTATPDSTVESALACAAAGDLFGFERLMLLDEASRARAEALFAQLPPAAKAEFGSAPRFIAACSVKNIPVGEAQVVWQREHDADEASVALWLRNPATPVGAVAFAEGGRHRSETGSPPPQLRADEGSSLVFLRLQHSEDGWRLRLPVAAVERIARDLALPHTGR